MESEASESSKTPSVKKNNTEQSEGKKIICYFTNWSVYRQGEAKFSPADVDTSLCTHVNYGFAVLHPVSLTMEVHDQYVDIQKNFYKQIVALKATGVKV